MVIRGFSATSLSMLTRGIGPPFKGTLLSVAPITLQKKLQVLPPAQSARRIRISGQSVPPRNFRNPNAQRDFFGSSLLVRPQVILFSLVRCYTLLLFGGRHPLWGIGVTSRMTLTLKPSTCNARIAASLPTPGPFTLTSAVLIPCSMACLRASWAANWAAKGVLFREPLNP